MGNSCSLEREEEIEEGIICCTRSRGRYLPKYSLGRVSVITVISSYLEFSGYSAVPEIELFGTEVNLSDTNQQRGRQTRPKYHTYKDRVYLDRLFLLSNLTWRRAHVTARLTGRDSDVKVNVLRRFH